MSLIKFDIGLIVQELANEPVMHVRSEWLSKETKLHAYTQGKDGAFTPTGSERDMHLVDIIMTVDGGGGFELFMSDEITGYELLSTVPVATGNLSDYVNRPDDNDETPEP